MKMHNDAIKRVQRLTLTSRRFSAGPLLTSSPGVASSSTGAGAGAVASTGSVGASVSAIVGFSSFKGAVRGPFEFG